MGRRIPATRRAPLAMLLLLPLACDGASNGGAADLGADTGARVDDGGAMRAFSCKDGAELTCPEQKALHEIYVTGQASKDPRVWEGRYEFYKKALYIVVVKEEKAVKGILINPKTPPDGATRIAADVAQGLEAAYRYDKEMAACYAAIIGGHQVFYDRYYSVAGQEQPAFVYDESFQQDFQDGGHAWTDVVTHETFHNKQDAWTLPKGWFQDETNYPANKDVLALALLELQIARAGTRAADAATCEKHLKQYVAARSEKIRIDPSDEKFVTFMDNPQEAIEGTADYINTRLYELVDPASKGNHYKGWIDDVHADMVSGELTGADALMYLVRHNFYRVGSAVLYMLDCVEHRYVSDFEAGKTPYAIVQTKYQLDTSALEATLAEAKTAFDYPALETVATKLAR